MPEEWLVPLICLVLGVMVIGAALVAWIERDGG